MSSYVDTDPQQLMRRGTTTTAIKFTMLQNQLRQESLHTRTIFLTPEQGLWYKINYLLLE
jgi:hypothetical protein